MLLRMFIKGLIHATDKSKFIMYAVATDKRNIYFNLEDFYPDTIETDINSELEKINVWLKLNKLSLNVKKTKSVIFSEEKNKLLQSHCL